MIDDFYYTDQGGRKRNEDFVITTTEGDYYFAILADGLGGMGKGDRASQTAVAAILGCIEESSGQEITGEMLYNWFILANREIVSMQTENCHMGSTLCVLCINEKTGKAIGIHVGDSRIYHFRNQSMEYCSFDHSVSRMAVESGEITMDQIRMHPDRNKLIRALGMESGLVCEVKEFTLDKASADYFLLCSDGFWEYVIEKEMLDTIEGSDSAPKWLGRMRAVLDINKKPGNDNNTAVTVIVK